MARRQTTAVCEHCGRTFTVCRFNAHRQKYCRDTRCVAERRRQRQRQYYRAKYRRDEAFRTAEQQRGRQGARQRRAAAAMVRCEPPATPPVPAVAPTGVLPVSSALLAGLVSHLIASDDPVEVRDSVRTFEHRGQRLAVAGAWTGRPPI